MKNAQRNARKQRTNRNGKIEDSINIKKKQCPKGTKNVSINKAIHQKVPIECDNEELRNLK